MNLIEMLNNELSNTIVSALSQKVGVSEEQVQTGFSAGIPAVLAGILKNGGGANSGFLSRMLSNVTNSGSEIQPNDILNQDHDSLSEKGKALLVGLFGNDTGAITNALSSSSGLSLEKSSGLMTMIVPVISRFISKIMTVNGWGISDLLGKIFENKDTITSALPQGLSSLLGLSNISMPDMGNINMPKVKVPTMELPKGPKIDYATTEETKSGGGFLKWLIPLLVIGLSAWWLMGKSGCNANKTTQDKDSLSTTLNSVGREVDNVVAGVKQIK